MDQQLHIASLISKSHRQEITPAEQKELDEWLSKNDANRLLYNKLKSEQALERIDSYQKFDQKKTWQGVLSEIDEAKVVKFSRPLWHYAAAVLLPLLIGAALFFTNRTPSSDPLAGIDEVITPGTQRAVLTLADGGKVELNRANPQKSLEQSGVVINQEQDKLSYVPENITTEPQQTIYNTLETPLGSTYQLALSDGTQVTLNAGSSLRFPVSFTDSIRNVYLVGEAFFDVTHTGAPFVVSSANHDVQVLGTQFNVSAYKDNEIATTLIEGSVRIETETAQQLLAPGEQSVWKNQQLMVAPVDVTGYISWTQGKIQFTNNTLEEVMTRLARWYDFEYVFEDIADKTLHFTGRIDNDQPISEVLKMLEITTSVEFSLDEKKIIIH